MKKIFTPKHPIEQQILTVLYHQEFARFRDMRPSNQETNLYSYYLKVLLQHQFIKKTVYGYTLDYAGFYHMVKAMHLMSLPGPVVLLVFVIQNSDGDILLARRDHQPFINQLALPYGRELNSDASTVAAAARLWRELFDSTPIDLVHAGDAYVRLKYQKHQLSSLVHVFRLNSDAIESAGTYKWVRPHALHKQSLAPGVEKIIARTFFYDPYFFEEYSEAW